METLSLILSTVREYLSNTEWWIITTQFLLLWIVYHAILGVYRLLSVRLVGRYQKPVSFEGRGERSILIVGDSTAVGTGSADYMKTIGAFLARDFPRSNIINRGVNGSLTRDTFQQLESVQEMAFDLVLIFTGGNDVWALTRQNRLREDLARVLSKAKEMSRGRVILVFFGNEGSAPFFPSVFSRFLLWRTEKVRQTFAHVSWSERVPFIELFSRPEENPFVKDPKKNFALDGLHPNEQGYWEWYKHLWRQMVQLSYTYKD